MGPKTERGERTEMNIYSLMSFIPSVKKKRAGWERIRDLIVQIEEQQGLLAEDAQMFRAIFCVSPTPMLVVGVEDAIIQQVNTAFVELTGYTEYEAVGKTIYDLALYEDYNQRAYIVSKILDEGYIKKEPVSFRMKNGAIRKCFLSSKVYARKGKKLMISVVDVAENAKKRADICSGE